MINYSIATPLETDSDAAAKDQAVCLPDQLIPTPMTTKTAMMSNSVDNEGDASEAELFSFLS